MPCRSAHSRGSDPSSVAVDLIGPLRRESVRSGEGDRVRQREPPERWARGAGSEKERLATGGGPEADDGSERDVPDPKHARSVPAGSQNVNLPETLLSLARPSC